MSLPSEKVYNSQSNQLWKQGELVEIQIEDVSDTGEGVGRVEGRVVFVPDTVNGDRALVRLVQVKRQFAKGKLHELLEPSPHRIRPGCIVADKCGGCQWQHIDYGQQLEIKRNVAIQALERIGGITNPPVDEVLSVHQPLKYRNKATYPFGMSATQQVQTGYYQKGSHKLVNLNQCPVQDERLNPLLAEIKRDIQQRGWPIYQEQRHQGELRHLGLRIGRRTGEMLLTLVVTQGNLPGVEEQAQTWLERYPGLVGVLLNFNPQRTNAIFGNQTRCIAGREYLAEEFAGLQFQLRADTFFQVNTETAEALLQEVLQELRLQGDEVLVDAYCGIGTFTLPLARHLQQAIGIEVQPEAIHQAECNAQLNQITNTRFYAGSVESLLPQLEVKPDIILLDPPRQGCDRAVLETLLQIQPQQIVYISCKPSTLARDLKILCDNGNYQLTRVQPADFFPQTSHVECAAFLQKS
ncbi:23S rRNA (uracil(1939)-C(5))-methyltransferase RlmD [Desertifilum sp. FACHB-1129]|uniref:23S rRNA (Uracil-5-)-methyltransferase RumA n=1 Tax=Desertifilum tharense IPPAS B-1220 TaxID=1781255 RepID=A0A1E5QLG3_9CYAN|nr:MULTISPECIES: 23S rRNA (uracil(1939)-C(5))-methyltransferase RlmD [Desertifilum]MDA0209943.1 23S rRNA (uracil(1939)-C(5))-methyltransferase RlmD [Cyanobacteria bacterium FC1]MBD2313789.1 23S rRNA (uracil(1939)-C(5))-methyltransferase RlmD [Desertifilum sp. FACHB-1129]MBD2324500.1 23S rRNA (uracil(1939)-C(5))-methyltransferase RlmD [Desertifilum sp. FACHB-866]MBD2334514.1 23S rRNA (uracil(1939)-C(5))-methyltransferase RlmD [Desertifilum sp. FACHB-868]OEJ75451.1 23S rRNA (uracil-5-)-methyltra